MSAGNHFDILILATDINVLSEECRAIHHEGDIYFADNNLNAWKIWYNIDNDITKYLWADVDNGKGVIYRMIDEFGNDCPYDFKNILFKRYRFDGIDINGKKIFENYYVSLTWANDLNDYIWCYTFSTRLSENDFSIIKDYSLNNSNLVCYNNIIKQYLTDLFLDEKQYNVFSLNNNVLFGIYNSDSKSYCNIFGMNCFYNTIENNFSHNTFGQDFSENIIGNNFNNNIIGNLCYINIFEDYFFENTIGNNCNNNIIGNHCFSNIIGNNFEFSIIGNYCDGNIIGNTCSNINFGNNCSYNIIGNCCDYIVFGYCKSEQFIKNNLVTFNNYYNNIIDNDVSFIIFGNKDFSNTDNKKIQNHHIKLGVAGNIKYFLNIEPYVTDQNYCVSVFLDKNGNLNLKDSI